MGAGLLHADRTARLASPLLLRSCTQPWRSKPAWPRLPSVTDSVPLAPLPPQPQVQFRQEAGHPAADAGPLLQCGVATQGAELTA